MRGHFTDCVVGDRYRLGHILGRGGMGAAYRAEDLRLHGRPCAVKVLDREARGQDDAARFGRELRIISALRSPFTVQVLDTGETDDGDPFIVMELLDGPTISSLVANEERLQGARAARLFQGSRCVRPTTSGSSIETSSPRT